MIYQIRQRQPCMRNTLNGIGLQDRTTVFTSPTDLSNLVAGVKNSKPALVREFAASTLNLIEGLETELKESAVEMRLSSGLCKLDSLHFLHHPFVRPILVAVADATGQKEIFLFSGVRYTNVHDSYILLFREIDASFSTRFIGHSIRDKQLNNLFPIMPSNAIRCSKSRKSGDGVNRKSGFVAKKHFAAEALSLQELGGMNTSCSLNKTRLPGNNPPSLYDLRTRKKIENHEDASGFQGMTGGNVFYNIPDFDASSASMIAKPVRFADAFHAAPAKQPSSGFHSNQSILFKVQHSTIKYGIEQRFFKAKALIDLTAGSRRVSADFTAWCGRAERWSCALKSALEESRIFSFEQNSSGVSTERRAQILPFHHYTLDSAE